MAKIKPEKAYERIVINGFAGIRNAASRNGPGASRCLNFRISPDGSLVKRSGWTTRYRLGQPIRAVWQGTLANESYLFAVSGSYVYAKLPGDSGFTLIYFLPGETGKVSFRMYSGELYLFDGSSIYRFLESTSTFTVAYGYVPLYGANWHPTQMGAVNEPLNMVYPRIRITYLNAVGSVNFTLPYTAQSIGHMDVDGTTVTSYTFTPGTNTFRIPESMAHGVLTVLVTLSPAFSQRSSLVRASQSHIYRTPDSETLLLYGGTGGYRVYYTKPVTDRMLQDSMALYSSSDPLYVPAGGYFSIGDTLHPVHALCSSGNRVIAFSDCAVWAIDRSEGDLICYPMEGGIGCSSPGGATLLGSDPVTVHSGGVYRIGFPSSSSDVCVPISLSDGVDELFPASLLSHGILAWCADRGELWLRDTTETESGILWVWNARRKEWFCYDHCPAVLFFEIDGQVGFGTSDGRLVFPDDASNTDDSSPIEALYQSNFLSFSHPESFKRAYRINICADTGSASPKLTVLTERYSRSFFLTATQTAVPETFDFRAVDSRFRVMRIELEDTGSARTRIYRISVLANR